MKTSQTSYISISGDWLADEISKSISTLCNNGFNVRAVVTDNHSANVSAFNMLLKQYETDYSCLFIKHPDNNNRAYLFYDNIHLTKISGTMYLMQRSLSFQKFL